MSRLHHRHEDGAGNASASAIRFLNRRGMSWQFQRLSLSLLRTNQSVQRIGALLPA
jgi:hypothetical protein